MNRLLFLLLFAGMGLRHYTEYSINTRTISGYRIRYCPTINISTFYMHSGFLTPTTTCNSYVFTFFFLFSLFQTHIRNSSSFKAEQIGETIFLFCCCPYRSIHNYYNVRYTNRECKLRDTKCIYRFSIRHFGYTYEFNRSLYA